MHVWAWHPVGHWGLFISFHISDMNIWSIYFTLMNIYKNFLVKPEGCSSFYVCTIIPSWWVCFSELQKGVRYECPLEDVITGLQIQCRGWRSVYYNPVRKGFLGMAPTSLGQILIQHKRWSEGFFQISLSNYSPFLLGHGKIKLGLQMGYSVCGFWALNSFPTFYYAIIPSLCFLGVVSVFPEVIYILQYVYNKLILHIQLWHATCICNSFR